MADSTGNTFPNPLASRKEKSSDAYILSYCKTAYAQWYNNFNTYIIQLKDNRKYAAGKQSVEDFRTRLGLDENSTSWMNVDLRPITVISKLVDIAVSSVMEQRFSIQFEALDPESKLIESKQRNKMLANMYLSKADKQHNISGRTGIPLVPQGAKLPDNNESFETFYLTQGKQGVTLAMEQLTSYVMKNNNFNDDIRRKIIRDLMVINKAATMRSYDANKNIKVEYADFLDLVYPYSKYDDFSNTPYVGILKQYTIAEIGQMTNKFDEKTLAKIAERFQGNTYNNASWNSGWGVSYEGYYNASTFVKPYYNFNIPTMRIWFKGISKEYIVKTKKGSGEYIDRKSQYKEEPNKELLGTSEKEYLYTGIWILNSDYIFNCEECDNIDRSKVNGGYAPTVKLPIEIISPDMYDMENKSLVEKAIPSEDQLNLIEQKIQQLMIMSKPPGNFINEAAFDETASIGKGQDDKKKAVNLYAMYSQTGSIAGRATDKSGNPVQFSPIQKIDNSYAAEMNALLVSKQMRMQEINDAMAFNDASNGRLANPDVPVGTQEMAMQGTAKALQNINLAQLNLVRRTVEGTTIMIQNSLRWNKESFTSAIGAEAVSAIEYLDKVPLATLGINIKVAPDARKKSETMQMLQNDIAKGVLATSDILRVEEALEQNPELAANILIELENKRADANQAAEIEKINANAEQQKQSALVASQMQQQTINIQLQADIKRLQVEYELKSKFQEVIDAGKLRNTSLVNEGNLNVEYAKEQKEVKVTQITKEGKLGVAVLQSQTKIASDEIKHHSAHSQIEHKKEADMELMENEPPEKVEEKD